MTTEKNRFSIALDDETFGVYKDFARLSNQPNATAIASILVSARDHFLKLTVLLQKAENIKTQALEKKADFVDQLNGLSNGSKKSKTGVKTL